nr:MAG TPA: hypothetical protein [Caudoviricetes sp.]
MPLRLSTGLSLSKASPLLRISVSGVTGSPANKNLPLILIVVATPFSIIVGDTPKPDI